MNTNKLLVAFFVILLVVLMGEVGFLFFTNKLPFQAPSLNNQVVTPEPKKNIKPAELKAEEGQAIKPEILDVLANIKRDIITSSQLRNDYYAYLTKVETDFGLKLYLKGDKYINNLYYTPEDTELITVQKYQEGGEPTPASIKDLEPGQVLFIQEDMDLLSSLTKSVTEVRILIYSSK